MISALRKTLKNFALALVATLGIAAAAHAQQASGNIMGEAVTGDTIVVRNASIGFQRELSIKEDGKYNLRRLPIGNYVVTVKHADGTESAPKQIVVQAGTTARVK